MRKVKVHKMVVMLILLAGLGAGLATTLVFFKTPQDIRNRAASNGPKLAIEPANKNVTVGDTFDLGITLTTGDDTVSAAALGLSYDPSAIQIMKFTPGTALPVVLIPESQKNGNLTVALAVNPTSPFKGSAIIGTVTVKVISAKSSAIDFTTSTAVASLGKNTNSLGGTTGTQIAVGNSTLPNPTATPTPLSTGGTHTLPTATPTPATAGTGSVVHNSFGSLVTTQPNITKAPVNPTIYIVTTQIPPQTTPYVPATLPSAPASNPPARSTNFIEQFFIALARWLATLHP